MQRAMIAVDRGTVKTARAATGNGHIRSCWQRPHLLVTGGVFFLVEAQYLNLKS